MCDRPRLVAERHFGFGMYAFIVMDVSMLYSSDMEQKVKG